MLPLWLEIVCIWHVKSEFYVFKTLSCTLIMVQCKHSAYTNLHMLCPSFCPKPGSLWQVKIFSKNLRKKSEKSSNFLFFSWNPSVGALNISISNDFHQETLFSWTLKRNPTYLWPINILLQKYNFFEKVYHCCRPP